jgi:hypothetical protein
VLYVSEIAITRVSGVSPSDTDLQVRWLAAGKVNYARRQYGRAALAGRTVTDFGLSGPFWDESRSHPAVLNNVDRGH